MYHWDFVSCKSKPTVLSLWLNSGCGCSSGSSFLIDRSHGYFIALCIHNFWMSRVLCGNTSWCLVFLETFLSKRSWEYLLRTNIVFQIIVLNYHVGLNICIQPTYGIKYLYLAIKYLLFRNQIL
jgi:hypothetical protein